MSLSYIVMLLIFNEYRLSVSDHFGPSAFNKIGLSNNRCRTITGEALWWFFLTEYGGCVIDRLMFLCF